MQVSITRRGRLCSPRMVRSGVLRADLGIAALRGVGTADRMMPLVSSVQGASLVADAKKEIAS